LEQLINGDPVRTEQISLSILIQLKITQVLNDTETHSHTVQHFQFLT